MVYSDFVPARLAKLRMQKGMSARDMSLTLGQADNYINTIENRKSLPSMQAFFYICEYLNVTPQEFFDEGNIYPSLIAELVENIKKLDESSLPHLVWLLRELTGNK